VQQSFEDAWDEWSAMEAVVKLEMLLEAEGLLIEDKPALKRRSCNDRGSKQSDQNAGR
jgi:hypothetical protein